MIPKSKINFLFVFIAISILAGCVSPSMDPASIPDIKNQAKQSKQASDELGDISGNILESTEKISENIDYIKENIPADQRLFIDIRFDEIKSEIKKIINHVYKLQALQNRLLILAANLVEEQNKINQWEDQITKSQTKNSELQKEIRELKDKNQQQFKQKLAWIGVFSVGGIGTCIVVALWTRSKIAIAFAVGFMAVLITSIAVTVYMKEIALVSIIVLGVAFLGIIGYIGWRFFVSKKMEEELVHTGEIAKQHLSESARKKLFGSGAEPGTVDNIQSKVTKQRVKQIREYNNRKRLGKLAPPLNDKN